MSLELLQGQKNNPKTIFDMKKEGKCQFHSDVSLSLSLNSIKSLWSSELEVDNFTFKCLFCLFVVVGA